jgi:F-type H+-transporting ATPase subunit epsilon
MARLEVFLVTPEAEVWSGEATMVIARGTEGEVGILAGHAPLLIRLKPEGTVRIQHAGGEERAEIGGGFMHVSTDADVTRVDVLAESVSLTAGG